MAGRTHKVTIRGEELVEACERGFGSFCPRCEAEDRAGMPALPPLEAFDVWPEPGLEVPKWKPVRYEVLSEYSPGKWTRVLGPTTRERAEQWWVLYYRDNGPDMRVREVGASR